MAREARELRSDISYSLPDHTSIKGLDLSKEIIGKIDLGDMAFLMLKDRLPNTQESVVFNAILVTLVDHGITPSSLATRLTYLGAPEALQGAVAAGLLGLGSRFVGTIGDSARMLQEALKGRPQDVDLDELATSIVSSHIRRKSPIPGLGHPVHKPVDPRTVRLFEIADQNGFSGRYVRLMKAIGNQAEETYRRPLPINATGAIGSIASEMGIPWEVARGLGIMSRAIGLVGHVLEEMRQPMAQEIWFRTEEEATSHLKSLADWGK
jgi:citrate synthase